MSQQARLSIDPAFVVGPVEDRPTRLDPAWRSIESEPDRVVPRAHPAAAVVDGLLTAELPPASWNMFLLAVPLEAAGPC